MTYKTRSAISVRAVLWAALRHYGSVWRVTWWLCLCMAISVVIYRRSALLLSGPFDFMGMLLLLLVLVFLTHLCLLHCFSMRQGRPLRFSQLQLQLFYRLLGLIGAHATLCFSWYHFGVWMMANKITQMGAWAVLLMPMLLGVPLLIVNMLVMVIAAGLYYEPHSYHPIQRVIARVFQCGVAVSFFLWALLVVFLYLLLPGTNHVTYLLQHHYYDPVVIFSFILWVPFLLSVWFESYCSLKK